MLTFPSSSAERTTVVRPSLHYRKFEAAQTSLQARPLQAPSKVPWGFAGMIVLIAAIECLISGHWRDFTDPVSVSWRFSAHAVKNESPGCDLLCLGDSLIKHGLVPSVLEQGTGLRASNLSAARAPALLTYFLFRRALDAGAHPAAIVINTKPAVLIADPQFNARYWQEVLNPAECLELFRLNRNGPFVLSTIVGRLLPSLRSRLEVQSNVLAALRGETDRIGAINRVLLRNWTVNRGANIAASGLAHQEMDPAEIERRLHPNAFHVDPTNARAIESVLRLARDQNIRVFWLLPPLSPTLQAMRDQSGAEARYERFIRSFVEGYPRTLTVLDGRRAGYPARMFIDATHLTGQGALALSQGVGAAVGMLRIEPRFATSAGWIALEPFSDPRAGTDVTVEDIEQSKRMLSADAPRNRENARPDAGFSLH
jgi:hypothetical protein